jgi:hypothetical protein
MKPGLLLQKSDRMVKMHVCHIGPAEEVQAAAVTGVDDSQQVFGK